MMGESPPKYMDHINGDPDDNRWENLRRCTATENAQNKKRKKTSFNGIKGVRPDYRSGTWSVNIQVNGKLRSFGPYYTEKGAHEAYEQFAKQGFGPFYRASACREPAKFDEYELNEAVEKFLLDK